MRAFNFWHRVCGFCFSDHATGAAGSRTTQIGEALYSLPLPRYPRSSQKDPGHARFSRGWVEMGPGHARFSPGWVEKDPGHARFSPGWVKFGIGFAVLISVISVNQW